MSIYVQLLLTLNWCFTLNFSLKPTLYFVKHLWQLRQHAYCLFSSFIGLN